MNIPWGDITLRLGVDEVEDDLSIRPTLRNGRSIQEVEILANFEI